MLLPNQTTCWGLHVPSCIRVKSLYFFPWLEKFFSPISGKILCWLQETAEMTPTSLRKKLNSEVPLTQQSAGRIRHHHQWFKLCQQDLVSFFPLLSFYSSVLTPNSGKFSTWVVKRPLRAPKAVRFQKSQGDCYWTDSSWIIYPCLNQSSWPKNVLF